MPLNQNYFEIFGLTPEFDIDRAALAERYRELQREFHPDKYAAKSEREQRLAMQYAAKINEAHTTLRDPVARAAYLLRLSGVEVSPEQTSSDAEFLMQQMVLRERLEEVRDAAEPERALDHLGDEVRGLFVAEQKHFAGYLTAGDLEAAKNSLFKLQFLAKLQRQVEDLEEDLLD
ncbi:Fe-S protein assembly co-chaperone HscB [Microbulbifer thermotolerans]|uniref:Fe-S protein assembly co-chaperone HscB n=1 Tax=Microbulbifer thermotolerans TaxID=252514 RepID=UPI002248C2B1|nr:Fe-S protein assembly co-chaperone HscB [Microbulbifer thermotolerans]MCX2784360.1 Fe-S protein assembly co-chaperone HscB [Microbulbifer thermotolerans]MCX2831481.1 Fe-S protein assembly co-chaperone HscB [Microbulbifer thermotolerans]